MLLFKKKLQEKFAIIMIMKSRFQKMKKIMKKNQVNCIINQNKARN